jgi:alanine dehydrogenase
MPGSVPITATWALTNATMPFVLKLASEGVVGALEADPGFMAGLNVAAGQVTCLPVAESQNRKHFAPRDALREACAPV